MKTYGYRKGEAQIFDLADGEKLPDGWQSRPFPGDHPHEKELGIVFAPPEQPKPVERPKLTLKK